MLSPVISIITTAYNANMYIEECLYSIYQQNFTNFEHIIVNDGSTDDTYDKILSFKENYRINNIVLINSTKVGRAMALNIGIKNAKSDIICIIDSDDLWHKSKLQIQYNIFINKSLDLLCTNSILFNNNILTNNISNDLSYSHTNNKLIKISLKKLLFQNIISHSSVMIKKEYCKYDDNIKSQIDYELWLRLLFNNPELKFYFLDLKLNYHRIHKSQNFESKGFVYKYNSIKLTNKYALKTKLFYIYIINLIKIPYYIFSRVLNKFITHFK